LFSSVFSFFLFPVFRGRNFRIDLQIVWFLPLPRAFSFFLPDFLHLLITNFCGSDVAPEPPLFCFSPLPLRLMKFLKKSHAPHFVRSQTGFPATCHQHPLFRRRLSTTVVFGSPPPPLQLVGSARRPFGFPHTFFPSSERPSIIQTSVFKKIASMLCLIPPPLGNTPPSFTVTGLYLTFPPIVPPPQFELF